MRIVYQVTCCLRFCSPGFFPLLFLIISVMSLLPLSSFASVSVRGQLKRHDTRSETRFRLSAKRTSQFKSAEASVQSTAGSRGVRISGSNAGYTMFRGSVKSTGYPLHSPVSPSFPLPCVTVCHHILTGVYPITEEQFGQTAGLCAYDKKETSCLCQEPNHVSPAGSIPSPTAAVIHYHSI